MQGSFLCSSGGRGSGTAGGGGCCSPVGSHAPTAAVPAQGWDFRAWVVGVSAPLPRGCPGTAPCRAGSRMAARLLGFNVWGFSGERLSELWGVFAPIWGQQRVVAVGMWVQFQLPEAEGGRAGAEAGTVPSAAP